MTKLASRENIILLAAHSVATSKVDSGQNVMGPKIQAIHEFRISELNERVQCRIGS